jgi:hypothetical protein
VVIEQPGIDIALMQGSLNGFQIHKRYFYLTTGNATPADEIHH